MQKVVRTVLAVAALACLLAPAAASADPQDITFNVAINFTFTPTVLGADGSPVTAWKVLCAAYPTMQAGPTGITFGSSDWYPVSQTVSTVTVVTHPTPLWKSQPSDKPVFWLCSAAFKSKGVDGPALTGVDTGQTVVTRHGTF